jgi:hypothetical protein
MSWQQNGDKTKTDKNFEKTKQGGFPPARE